MACFLLCALPLWPTRAQSPPWVGLVFVLLRIPVQGLLWLVSAGSVRAPWGFQCWHRIYLAYDNQLLCRYVSLSACLLLNHHHHHRGLIQL